MHIQGLSINIETQVYVEAGEPIWEASGTLTVLGYSEADSSGARILKKAKTSAVATGQAPQEVTEILVKSLLNRSYELN